MSIEILASKLNIGNRIKTLRVNQNRTMQEIGDQCGLSKSMISKIENNKTIPSVSALVKIANALGTNISDLMESNGHLTAELTSRQEAEENLTPTEKGYEIFPYASKFHDKKMQPFLFVARKGETKPHLLTHEGEEFVYVLEGEMKMQVGNQDYILKTGDSLYFNSTEKHGIMPVTDKVVYLDIFS